MIEKLATLYRFLKLSNLDEEADGVKRLSIKIDPLSAAVSLGLLNPDVLSVYEEEGQEEDLEEFNQILEEIQAN